MTEASHKARYSWRWAFVLRLRIRMLLYVGVDLKDEVGEGVSVQVLAVCYPAVLLTFPAGVETGAGGLPAEEEAGADMPAPVVAVRGWVRRGIEWLSHGLGFQLLLVP